MTATHPPRSTAQPRRITWHDLDADPALLAALVDAYRTVFGGAEWREWTRCTHPDCLRQYSSDESRHLFGVCACGRAGTLATFHPEHDVIRSLRKHLEDPAQSYCYLWIGQPASVDAFCWGYQAPVSAMAEDLATDDDNAAHIEKHLASHLGSIGLDPVRAPLCRFAEAGVALSARNTGLTWLMAHQMLAWAAELHTSTVIVRTSDRSPMYGVCSNHLGMRVIYRYTHPTDDRVILANTVADMQRALESRSLRNH
jgi:hypothetical protein